GDISTAQKINDETWATPEMTTIRGGVLADALAVLSAGVIGGMAQSTSSGSVGVSLATGVTSRWIGFSAGAIFILCAFVPIMSTFFVVMADPVKGAVLIYVACFMIVSGLQLVMTRLLDARKIFVVGTAIAAGLSVDMLPEIYRDVPPALAAFTTSSFSFAVVVAVLLNLLFRIGISSRATLVLSPSDNAPDAVVRFLHDQGGAWGARKDVIQRATTALTEFVDVAAPMERAGQTIRINARFDQFILDISVLYGGDPVELPDSAPSIENLADGADHLRRLSGYIIRSTATRVRSSQRDGLNLLQLRFEN
ncbi:MAG: solute carrier family 23 protein, partial [Pseudomonadota bacterium]